MKARYDKSNFHKRTFCIFKESDVPSRPADYVSNSGSRYWFDESGVYRHANHWGRAAKCKWRLLSSSGKSSRLKGGYASWSDFAPDNDHERLYYLKFDQDEVSYFHKSDARYAGELLRTSAETISRIRKVREYLKRPDVSTALLNGLIETDLPVHELHKLHTNSHALTP